MTLNSFWLLLKSWWIICKILWITTYEEKNISKFQMSNERLSYKTKYIFESQKDGVDEDVLLVDGLRDGTGVRLPEPHFNRIIKYFLSRLRGIWFDLCYEFPPISLSPLYIRQRDKDCSAPLTLQLPHSSGLSTHYRGYITSHGISIWQRWQSWQETHLIWYSSIWALKISKMSVSSTGEQRPYHRSYIIISS